MILDDLKTYDIYDIAVQNNWEEVRELLFKFVGARSWNLSEEELDVLIRWADDIALGDSWTQDEKGERYFRKDQHIDCGGTGEYISATMENGYLNWKEWADLNGIKTITYSDLCSINRRGVNK